MTTRNNDVLRQACADVLARYIGNRAIVLSKVTLMYLRDRGLSSGQVNQAVKDLMAAGRLKAVEEHGMLRLYLAETEGAEA